MIPENHPVRQKLANLASLPPVLQPQVSNALKIISENYDLKQAGVRKSLPEHLNARRLNLFSEFMDSFQSLVTEVETIDSQFWVLKKQYLEMNHKWQGIKSSTKTLFKDSLELQVKKKELEARAKESEQFYREYSISEAEMAVLEAPEISNDFFSALDKIHEMRKKVEQAESESNYEAVKADSMRSSVFTLLTDYEEIAVEKLYQWLQSVIKVKLSLESPELSPLVLKAYLTIASREILWQSCLEETGFQRKSVVAKAFMDALIKGGPNGNPRPIEFHAYDSVRYVGDIFAWIHQSCASEHELLCSIVKKWGNEQVAGEGEKKPLYETFIKENVDKHTDGISRILEARLNQVFQTPRPLLVLFKISHLILFYSSVYEKFLLESSNLLQCMRSLYHESVEYLQTALNDFSESLSKSDEAPPVDLLPPKIIRESVSQLKEMTRVFEASSATAGSAKLKSDFRPILSGILDPLTQVAILGSSALSKAEQSIYIINCLSHFLLGIKNCSFTVQKVDEIQGLIEVYTQGLVDELHQSLMAKSGLLGSKHDSRKINAIVRQFVDSPGDIVDPLLLSKLSNSRISSNVKSSVIYNFVANYSRLYPQIKDLELTPSQIDSFLLPS